MIERPQIFNDYETMTVACVISALMYHAFALPWDALGLVSGFTSAVVFHGLGGTFQAVRQETRLEAASSETTLPSFEKAS